MDDRLIPSVSNSSGWRGAPACRISAKARGYRRGQRPFPAEK